MYIHVLVVVDDLLSRGERKLGGRNRDARKSLIHLSNVPGVFIISLLTY
jgi:hypothetical protein